MYIIFFRRIFNEAKGKGCKIFYYECVVPSFSKLVQTCNVECKKKYINKRDENTYIQTTCEVFV